MNTKKFIEIINVDDWEVETDSGFENIKTFGETVPYKIFRIETKNGYSLNCADTHILFDFNLNEIFVKDLKIGDKIITNNGVDEVFLVEETNRLENMYDLMLSDESNHRYYTNGILSHNTYLAKKLNEEVFGDEKSMVRLDMSEYADKTSTNKLIGSGAGYVGYEEGGLLTEAIKKNNHCVLLLDEIEKADEEIFNMFLQVFDEGRLTDNKGVTVDFRNVIIIMTSNIGTREANEQKPPIGFGERKEEMQNNDIIMKVIKKKLPPEFINRIDEIVFFNKLTDDNLHDIIKIEIGKVENRVKRMGYSFDDSIKKGKLVDNIFNEVKKESEYGARPILREIQRQLEDKLTDFLLDNNVKKGYTFTYTDIYKER